MNVQSLVVDVRGRMSSAVMARLTHEAKRAKGTPTLLTVQFDDEAVKDALLPWCRGQSARIERVESLGDHSFVVLALHGAHVSHIDELSPVILFDENEFANAKDVERIDAIGMKSPAPILLLRKAIQRNGDRVMLLEVVSDDPRFPEDLNIWMRGQALTLLDVHTSARGVHNATLGLNGGTLDLLRTRPPAVEREARPRPEAADEAPTNIAAVPRPDAGNRAAILALHGDHRLLAALTVAIGCAAQGMVVELFLAYEAIETLRADQGRGWLQPFSRSQSKPPDELFDLLQEAARREISLVVCTATRPGLSRDDLIRLPNLTLGGLIHFGGVARNAATSLVF